MKAQGFTPGIVVTADQQRSRTGADDVPRALDALRSIEGFTLTWERTVGDEIQALTFEPRAAVSAVETLVHLRGWQLGLGIGPVETPIPPSTREARGRAYVDARTAVDRAKSSPVRAAAVGVGSADIEAALWMYCALLGKRSVEGWEAARLLTEGLTQTEAAERLGISPSAVSQRVARASVEVADAGGELLVRLLGRALRRLSAVTSTLTP